MKKNVRIIVLMILGMFLYGSIFAQKWSGVAYEKNFDTVIVKGTNQRGGMPPLHIRAYKVDGTFDKTFFRHPEISVLGISIFY